ncbi:hypothetical protein NC651_040585 [Populus alba x Populus x berolinensis]|nr:hypothetical protein NC651_040585 [Populus alba x Populus x berolinensis]
MQTQSSMKMRARKSILCEKATEFPCVLPLRHLPNSEKKRCKAIINGCCREGLVDEAHRGFRTSCIMHHECG